MDESAVDRVHVGKVRIELYTTLYPRTAVACNRPQTPQVERESMDAHFTTTQSSPPTAASVAVLLSGTMRGFREGCIASLREHVVQPNAQHGVAIYLATYTESDCGKKVRSMRREGALTGVSLRDGVTVLSIKSLRASDINATYRRYPLPPG